ncbi:MAG: radical SAM protein [Alphaproteobacteria bacterium]|nr:radical SAM protein [Alphaproteobacteria bacterium]MBL7097514.1 radical SAM protein [Alphaproteobacteria bacterium]
MGVAHKKFCLVLVKPSHYDDDGYVIQWALSAIPSNSLAALYGLARDCAARRVLGDDVDIDIHAIDETNTRVHPDRIARMIKQADAGMVMLVGVQSNQFPRALDIARPLRAAGIQVGVGGFHVSGVLSMLDGKDAYLDRAKQMGLSLFAGEAEGRLELVLRDAFANDLKPLYNFMEELPSLAGAPIPILKAERAQRNVGGLTSFDAGRGCPYQCSFCTIINVQGRVSRRRTPDDVEEIIRANAKQGLDGFFITDDNFARNKDWEEILDRIIHLREVEKLKITLVIQVDTLAHKIPNFIEKCARAGAKRVFIGMENINPDNLMGAKKRQNRITEYRKMLLAWKNAGATTYAGYILGFPNDTYDSIMRDIDLIKRELPVDILEFFYLTPLPGSEDHQKLFRKDAPLDPDLNKYDLNHICTTHPKMSADEWTRAYRDAWKRYYTLDHIETMLKRTLACGGNAGTVAFFCTWFTASLEVEGVHPLESGVFRRKYRLGRRPELPRASMLEFYPAFWFETVKKLVQLATVYIRIRRRYLPIKHNPDRRNYIDHAITPVTEDEETRELFQTGAAQAYLDQEHRLEKLRHGEAA